MVRNKSLAFILLLLISQVVWSQILDPVKWTTDLKQISEDTFEIKFNATIDEGWHLYSTTHIDGGIGIPTEFSWTQNPDLEFINSVQETGNLTDEYSAYFKQQQKYFAQKATFAQKVKANKETTAKAEVMFQVCNDKSCLPPDYKEFEFSLKPRVTENKAAIIDKKEDSPQEIVTKSTESVDTLSTDDSSSITSLPPPQLGEPALENDNITSPQSFEKNTDVTVASPKSKNNFWEIFLLGFGGGLLALVMPCMYPMIPLTVSLFTKQSKTKKEGIFKAIIYGLSIIGIFVGLGLIISILFGGSAINSFATHPWLNIFLFVIFIVFALSFFGLFEITLPSNWINKADKQADKGGFVGIFFMALVLVLVSFSCTGPIIGLSLGSIAESQEYFGPTIAMFAFALAIAIPFSLFAMFPGWLNSIPKSGGWLNTVKVVLGFIELAFAFKFLSNADLVWQAGWLTREVFLAIWIGIFLVMGLYLLNFFRLSHDSETKSIGAWRMLTGILSLVFVVYMIPGLFGAPLKLLSGLIPPKNYSESPFGFFNSNSASDVALPENAHSGPHQIPSFYDLDDAFAYAKTVNKPVMLDFTGDACANCRKVEDNVWSDEKVKNKLINEVVVASLYVDRRVDLPEEDKIFSPEKGRNLKTIGDKWGAFQIKHFKSNAQPLYVIVDENMNTYNPTLGAEYDIDTYVKWMDEGIQNFKNKKPIK